MTIALSSKAPKKALCSFICTVVLILYKILKMWWLPKLKTSWWHHEAKFMKRCNFFNYSVFFLLDIVSIGKTFSSIELKKSLCCKSISLMNSTISKSSRESAKRERCFFNVLRAMSTRLLIDLMSLP